MADLIKTAIERWVVVAALIATPVSLATWIQVQLSERPTREEVQETIDRSLGRVDVQLQQQGDMLREQKADQDREFQNLNRKLDNLQDR